MFQFWNAKREGTSLLATPCKFGTCLLDILLKLLINLNAYTCSFISSGVYNIRTLDHDKLPGNTGECFGTSICRFNSWPDSFQKFIVAEMRDLARCTENQSPRHSPLEAEHNAVTHDGLFSDAAFNRDRKYLF